ncbi:MAG: PAS domain S-box protein [Candidatus Thorarchaeota archaeon]
MNDSPLDIQLMFDLVDHGIIIVDGRGRIRDSNRGFLDMIGLNRAMLISRKIDDFLSDDDHLRLIDAMRSCESNEVRKVALTWTRQDSTRYKTMTTLGMLPRRTADDQAYFLMIRQVHEKEEDTELEFQYRTLLNQAQIGIMIWQMNPVRISYVNPKICELLGYTQEELLSLRDEDAFSVLHPEDRAIVANRFKQRLSGSDVARIYETRGLRKDGTSIWLQVTASYITYQGEPASLTTILDVTDEVIARLQIQASESKYRKLAEGSIQGIVLLKEGRIQYANPAYSTITGYSSEELYRKTSREVLEIIHPEDRNSLADILLDTPKQFQNYSEKEFRILRKDGSIRWLNATTSRFLIDNEPALQQTLVDITDRKEAENKLKSAAEAAMLYLDIMGHDIRNQLQAMLIGTETLRAKLPSDAALESVIDSVMMCERLISGIHATEGLLFAPMSETNLNNAIKNVVNKTKQRYPEAMIETTIPEGSTTILADSHLYYLLQIILENAIIHNQSDEKRVWIILEEVEGRYNLSISDNGQGFSDSRKSELFDQDRRFGGIGVHQARGIMDKYAGSISVEDRISGVPKQGAKFVLRFPKA